MADRSGASAYDWTVLGGDCAWWMRELPEASVDAVITDPPYGIGFDGHEWDQPGLQGKRNGEPASGRFGRSAAIVAGRYDHTMAGNRLFQLWCQQWATEALRILKPGGHLLAFSSPRTYHRLGVGVEDAGLEIRGKLNWLFGEGFPKALNVAKAFDRAAGYDTGTGWEPVTDEAKAWVGWQTHLKPGHEPIVLARKPLDQPNVPTNLLAHGVGALHVDACRIPVAAGDKRHDFRRGDSPVAYQPHDRGRFPADVVVDHLAAGELDDQSGVLVSGANPRRRGSDKFRSVYGDFAGQEECEPTRGTDVGGASRFYYCAKTSHLERHAGCEDLGGNIHPTPKPIDLMRWLVRLVTGPAAVVVDPFCGSGGTGIACVLEGREFIGIERERDYIAIAEARIAHWQQRPEGPRYAPRPPAPADQLDLLGVA